MSRRSFRRCRPRSPKTSRRSGRPTPPCSFLAGVTEFQGESGRFTCWITRTSPARSGTNLDEHGRIEGKVFAADDQRYGVSWTVDLTHELLEMLGDPTTNNLIDLPDGRQCIREVCNAVEDDSIAYTKKG